MSHLTRSRNQLWADLLTNLGGSGSELTMSEAELIAAARNTYGGSVSALTTSKEDLIASLVVAAGGSASSSQNNEDEMLASLATALGASNWSAATKSAVESLAEAVNLADGGGGGDEYVAPAITISAGSSVERGDFLTDVVDGPTGFISFYVKPDAESVGVDFARTANGNFEARFEGPTGTFQANIYDNLGDNSLELRGIEPEPLFSWGEWNHVLFAWDVAYAEGSRRFVVYLNDVPIEVDATFDDGDENFDIDYTNNNFLVLMPFATGVAPLSFADFGVWFNSNIIEADSTVSEVNRRKFISASGKPVDPANWPANPVIKFSGDESAFLTNQGSGGAFTLVSGTIDDAADSPSD